VRQFAEVARQEYCAVASGRPCTRRSIWRRNPRWVARRTFGPDAERVAEYTRAYLEGFQGPELGTASVSCITKHFPGGGPQRDGEDPHFPYGREQDYPAGRFDYHLVPFVAAIDAGTAGLMPYYGMPVGLVVDGEAIEEVGFGFNKQILTGLLRTRLGFDGVICTDWGLVTPMHAMGLSLPARAWGVEHLDAKQRVQKIIEAGADQFGASPAPTSCSLVAEGRVSEARIDKSARRLLLQKFELGLFDDPLRRRGRRRGHRRPAGLPRRRLPRPGRLGDRAGEPRGGAVRSCPWRRGSRSTSRGSPPTRPSLVTWWRRRPKPT
jgi:beta-glucosidase